MKNLLIRTALDVRKLSQMHSGSELYCPIGENKSPKAIGSFPDDYYSLVRGADLTIPADGKEYLDDILQIQFYPRHSYMAIMIVDTDNLTRAYSPYYTTQLKEDDPFAYADYEITFWTNWWFPPRYGAVFFIDAWSMGGTFIFTHACSSSYGDLSCTIYGSTYIMWRQIY